MQVLLYILIILAIIIVIVLIRSAMLPDEYVIERSTTIQRPSQLVYDYIKYLKNAENYNKWVMTDPGMKKQLRGIDGTIGFVYAWDSDNKQVGTGEQEIKNMQNGQRIDYEIRFVKPFKNVCDASLSTTALSAGETRVTWQFSGMRNYMMKLFHVVLNIGKALGRDIETSLSNLKNILEKKLMHKLARK